MKLLKNIFSIKNQDVYKIVTLLGTKFQIRSNKLVIKKLQNELKCNDYYFNVQINYKRVLERLKEKIKTEKLKVLFYTNEPQKWQYESVYREFENSSHFEPKVIVVPRYRVHIGKDTTRMSLEEQYDFFKERNYNVEYGYKNGKYLALKTFNPDIIFFIQKPEVPNIDDFLIVSEYALTFNCPYAYCLSTIWKNYRQDFQKLLFANFVEHKFNLSGYDGYKTGNELNCIITGHPKLDVYTKKTKMDISKYWKNSDKIKIIYAPHHSFQKDDNFKFSTFPKNYKYILELAKKYSDITTWIFKPHPMLKYSIINEGLMSKKEAENYYQQWSTVGRYYDSGDYFDIFKSSDLMITDCESFLAEYLPSQNPLIRLRNPKSINLNKLGEFCTSEYYNVYSNEELENVFKELVINKNDYKKEAREKLVLEIIDYNETSAKKICKYIEKMVYGE